MEGEEAQTFVLCKLLNTEWWGQGRLEEGDLRAFYPDDKGCQNKEL